jgi:hypothetical protein
MKLIKELNYFRNLREDLEGLGDGEYAVYKATAKTTEKVYYGYSKGTDDEDIRRAFFSPQNRTDDPTRGTLRMIDVAGGAEEIEFELLDVVGDEETAMLTRNEEREKDPQSIVPASAFPAHVYKQAKEKNPEYFAAREKEKLETMRRTKMQKALDKLRTARDAYHLFDKNELAALRRTNGDAVVQDFDRLSPRSFADKYNIKLGEPKL